MAGKKLMDQLFSMDAVTTVMESLLPVHAAMTHEWLVDAACTAAEKALNAPVTFVFFEDQEGRLERRQPASDIRRRSVQRAVDALGLDAFDRKIDPASLPAFAEALESQEPVVAAIHELLAPLVSEEAAKEARIKLSVEQACLAPMETAGERIGALLLLVSGDADAGRARALAAHIACAAVNLRQAQAERVQGNVDVIRSVFDQRKIEGELQRELARAERYKRQVSIAVIEATNAKLLREKFGRFLADRLLQRLGETLAQNARYIDVIGVYRDSGYTMILTEASPTAAEAAAKRLLAEAREVTIDGEPVPGLELHLVAGHATSPQDGTTTDALFAAAQGRMYSAAA
jgi:diguanylate cyclase (GGDEF)-like protein